MTDARDCLIGHSQKNDSFSIATERQCEPQDIARVIVRDDRVTSPDVI
jgi:hypothetical protein